MASTYVDNFTILDTINAQSPSATQYNLNETAGVINADSYMATGATTHTIPTALRSFPIGAILDDGYSQRSLYDLLLQIQVNWDTAMMSLDDSSGVDTTTYEAGAALGSLAGTYNIYPNGIGTDKLAVYLQAIATKFAACTALLDADGTITDTDYASTLDIKFTAKTGALSLLDVAFDITANGSLIKTTGIDQGALVDFLNKAVTNINALWVKLDADI